MNIKVSSKLMLSFLMGKARHALNNKYAVSLQYLKKELSYEVDVLYAVKHESILQADAFIFDGWAGMPKVPGQVRLRKKLGMKLGT